jgi:hypothetical protein
MYETLASSIGDENESVENNRSRVFEALHTYKKQVMMVRYASDPNIIYKVAVAIFMCGYFIPWVGVALSLLKIGIIVCNAGVAMWLISGILNKEGLRRIGLPVHNGINFPLLGRAMLRISEGYSLNVRITISALSIFSMLLPFAGISWSVLKILSIIPGTIYFKEIFDNFTGNPEFREFSQQVQTHHARVDEEVNELSNELKRRQNARLLLV